MCSVNLRAIIEPPQLQGDVASMAWKLHAIEQRCSCGDDVALMA